MNIKAWVVLSFLFSGGLIGCASINFDYKKEVSHPDFDTDETWLGKRYASLKAEIPEEHSAFHLLLDGVDALSARLLLAKKAEKTLDTQYYLIKTDQTSMVFIGALLDAADRGVRVRLLLDDVFTLGYDFGIAALDSHENLELRVFNPFNRGALGRAWSGITDLSRINRRMHTKSFTVDSQTTIIGGRNIADEYFGAHETEKFGDLDVVGVGPVAQEVSTMFDTYWNHATAMPVPAFAKMPDDPADALQRLRQRIAESKREIVNGPYAAAVSATSTRFLQGGPDAFEIAPYNLVYDSPDKGIKSKAGPRQSITKSLYQSFQSAQNRVIALSPYFVPLKAGVEFFGELEARGVDISVVTNSLAANNHAPVHSGYAAARKALLREGVELFEVRPDASIPGAELFAASGAKATLHTKAFLVDDTEVFIGSFNIDPRSALLNTESGLLIHSKNFGEKFEAYFERGKRNQTYRVQLDDSGRLQWKTLKDGRELVYTREPEASWLQRFVAAVMRVIPVRSQL